MPTAPVEELAGLRNFSEEHKRIEAVVTLPDIFVGSMRHQLVPPVQGGKPSQED